MDWVDILFKAAPYIVGSFAAFWALYWKQSQILVELKTRKDKDEHQDRVIDAQTLKIHDLEITTTRLEEQHNGQFALLGNKIDGLHDMLDIISKRLNQGSR